MARADVNCCAASLARPWLRRLTPARKAISASSVVERGRSRLLTCKPPVCAGSFNSRFAAGAAGAPIGVWIDCASLKSSGGGGGGTSAAATAGFAGAGGGGGGGGGRGFGG